MDPQEEKRQAEEKNQDYSRVDKNADLYPEIQKREGTFKKIIAGLVGLLVIFLLFLIFSEKPSNQGESNRQTIEFQAGEENASLAEGQDEAEEEAETASAETESEESAEDPAEAGSWEPVGTSQTGPHVTDYSNGSQDRIEIKQAVAMATGLNEADIIEEWVGNDGTEDGVEATVRSASTGESFIVHLKWRDGQGWQPISVTPN